MFIKYPDNNQKNKYYCKKEEQQTEYNFKYDNYITNYYKSMIDFCGKKSKLSSEAIQQYIDENPNAKQEDIAKHFGVYQTAVSGFIKRHPEIKHIK